MLDNLLRLLGYLKSLKLGDLENSIEVMAEEKKLHVSIGTRLNDDQLLKASKFIEVDQLEVLVQPKRTYFSLVA